MEYPTATEIELAAAKAGLTMSAVFRQSGVSHESFHREKRGDGRMTPRTAFKLMGAICGIKAA